MQYVPKEKKPKYYIIVLALLVVVLIVGSIFAFSHQNQETNLEKQFTIDGVSEEEMVQVMKEESKEFITIKDHFYYGESLNLFEEKYDVDNKDTLSGKTLLLENVVDGNKFSMTLENSIDSKLLVDELEAGFYRLYVIDNLVSKRLIYDEMIDDDIFHSVVRNGYVNEVTLYARNDLLQEYGMILDKNYMYLKVTKVKASDDEIDVLIDPYGLSYDFTYIADLGYQNEGLIENDEMYQAALWMQERLQSYGLRVEISRKSKDEDGRTYGEDGHLAIGYQKKAKYYLMLRFNTHGNTGLSGFEIQHSYYTSKTLARNINYGVSNNTDFNLSPMYSGNDAGIVSGILLEGVDGRVIYDDSLYLRESGGRATMAGCFSESAREMNASFKDLNGMYGLKINFAYISNDDDVKYWKKHKQELVYAVADAFAQGINVEG